MFTPRPLTFCLWEFVPEAERCFWHLLIKLDSGYFNRIDNPLKKLLNVLYIVHYAPGLIRTSQIVLAWVPVDVPGFRRSLRLEFIPPSFCHHGPCPLWGDILESNVSQSWRLWQSWQPLLCAVNSLLGVWDSWIEILYLRLFADILEPMFAIHHNCLMGINQFNIGIWPPLQRLISVSFHQTLR